MIAFIELVRDNGRKAWIRPDEIAAFSENETKGPSGTVPCMTIMLRNNVAWHFPGLTSERLKRIMGSAAGEQVNIITESAEP